MGRAHDRALQPGHAIVLPRLDRVDARSEIYQAQERAFKELQARAANQIAEARTRSDEAIRDAKRQLAEDAEAAKASLSKDSEALANQIADSLLRRRAS